MRLGGLAALAGLLAGLTIQILASSGTLTPILFVSLVPVFLAGLWEDLGHGVSAKSRFFSAMISAAIAVSSLGYWVSRGNLPGLDSVMGFVPAGVFVTIFVAAAFCHAVNLIDGMNGLAAKFIIFSALGLAFVANKAGLPELVGLSVLVSAATLGFQLFNWPSARLFLGDAGAYSLGHLLIWIGISIIALAPNAAVPAILLILFYPLADTIHTVFRRYLEGNRITAPDRKHLHQKVQRGLEIIWIGLNRRHISNPLTAIILLPLILAPVVAGVLLWDQPIAAWCALLGFGIAFSSAHLLVVALVKRRRKFG